MRFSDVSLTKRILVCAALPAVVAVWLAYGRIADGIVSYREATHVGSVSVDLAALADVIHAVQRERGQTAGVLAASDQAQFGRLDEARQSTDRLARRLEELSSHTGSMPPGSLSASLDGLRELRQRVDLLELSAATATLRYSDVVAGLLALSKTLGDQGSDSAIADEIAAYSLFSQMKELAGQERATGNGVITAGVVDKTALTRLSVLHGSQAALLEEFAARAPAFAHAARSIGVAGEGPLAAMRSRLLLAGAGGDVSGLDAATWYRLTTERIDTMRALEQRLLEQVREDAAGAAAAEERALVVLGVSLAGALAGSLLLSLAIGLGVVRPIKRLTAAIEQLAEGDAKVSVGDTSARDEVGAMSRAVARALEEARRQAEHQRQEEMARDADARRIAEAAERERAVRSQAVEYALDQLVTGLDALSAGDLRYRINAVLDADFDGLRLVFNRSVETLEQLVATAGGNANVIDEGCADLRGAADELARRTAGQAAALEEAAAALEQVASAVKMSSGAADDAQKSSTRASDDTSQATIIVSQTVEAMQEIAHSSSRIGHIINVIDEIAFQTNLLALNAGVEAARAGEAGKGFAVVAQEVRELAQRSASAAREIKSLVEQASKDVSNGVSLVGRTGEALHGIEQQVRTVNGQMLAIAQSAKEQSVALAEISGSIAQLDQITQQNASMVEETNAASVTLAAEASKLRDQLAAFRTSEQQSAEVQTYPAAA
ncbi:methyl-accepting chemotaxis protein [Pseudorhizobium flavum]|uniref:methyl-accepting chemotaxis protein n=1 Tax=Pseudorhizobium flavum TaxID=1335061 RepID=UPI00376F94D6